MLPSILDKWWSLFNNFCVACIPDDLVPHSTTGGQASTAAASSQAQTPPVPGRHIGGPQSAQVAGRSSHSGEYSEESMQIVPNRSAEEPSRAMGTEDRMVALENTVTFLCNTVGTLVDKINHLERATSERASAVGTIDTFHDSGLQGPSSQYDREMVDVDKHNEGERTALNSAATVNPAMLTFVQSPDLSEDSSG